jgi:hypothetical protein
MAVSKSTADRERSRSATSPRAGVTWLRRCVVKRTAVALVLLLAATAATETDAGEDLDLA